MQLQSRLHWCRPTRQSIAARLHARWKCFGPQDRRTISAYAFGFVSTSTICPWDIWGARLAHSSIKTVFDGDVQLQIEQSWTPLHLRLGVLAISVPLGSRLKSWDWMYFLIVDSSAVMPTSRARRRKCIHLRTDASSEIRGSTLKLPSRWQAQTFFLFNTGRTKVALAANPFPLESFCQHDSGEVYQREYLISLLNLKPGDMYVTWLSHTC